MKVLLLSDTHGVLDARIADMAAQVDLIVHGGDIGRLSVLETLRSTGREVIAVRGNNDSPAKCHDEDAALAELPTQARVDLPGGQLVVEHGDAHPARHRHARLRAAHPDARAIFYGHSHRLVIDREAQPWILNAGAAGRQRTHGGPACLLLSATRQRWAVRPRRFEL